MKNQYLILLLFAISIINITCKDEFPVNHQEYPVILTKEVETITDTGIIASAEILMRGEEIIKGAGFIWSKNEGANINSSSKIVLGSNIDNVFDISISHDLCLSQNYFLRAYVITKEHIVYGNEVEFKSKGSKVPFITDIEPKKGVDGTNITISGGNFSNYNSNNILKFNNNILQIDSCSEKKIYFTTPQIPESGTIKISLNVGCENSIQEPDFTIVAPEITEIIPNSAYIGDTIKIIGHNFNNEISKNKLFLDETEISIVYADTNLLKAVIPYVVPNEKVIILKIGAKHIQTNYTINSQWIKKMNFPAYSIKNSTAFVIDDNIYIGFGSDGYYSNNKFWKYNIINDSWSQLNDFPGESRSHSFGFSYNEKGYIICGGNIDLACEFWEYNPNNDSWTQIQDFPGIARFDALGFMVEDTFYFGFGNELNGTLNLLNDFWAYNFILKSWTQLPDFPANINYNQSAKPFGFEINKKIYIGIGSSFNKINQFWKFETQSLLWIQLNNYPGFSRTFAVGFAIESSGYMGIGCGSNGTKDFWKYYPKTDSWIQLEDYPGAPQCGAISISANGKAYVGLGMNYNFKYDFWEFSPNIGSNN